MGVLGSGDHDHDHDDEHDVHSCHYGLVPDIDLPAVEDECAYVKESGESGKSYIFECESSTEGHVSVYNGIECNGTAIEEYDITDTNRFDCSTESECDVIILTVYDYGNDTMDCGETSMAQETTQIYLSSGSTCVNTSDGTWIGITNVGDNTGLLNFYGNSSCNAGVLQGSVNISTGCREFFGSYLQYDVELEVDDDDDSAFGLYLVNNVFVAAIAMAIIGFVSI